MDPGLSPSAKTFVVLTQILSIPFLPVSIACIASSSFFLSRSEAGRQAGNLAWFFLLSMKLAVHELRVILRMRLRSCSCVAMEIFISIQPIEGNNTTKL